MDWRLIVSGIDNAFNNMAVDEVLMNAQTACDASPTLRLYGWRPAAVSVGYFQKAEKEIDFVACADLGIEVVRRMTGGRAVYHAAELTYSITIREDHPMVPKTITASYMLFSSALLAALEEIGISAQLSMPRTAFSMGGRAKPASAACFDAPSHYEITVGGRKLVGSAQLRKNGVVLQHGSILIDFSAYVMAALLQTKSSENQVRLVEMLKKRATSLTEQLKRTVSWEEVAGAIIKRFGPTLGVSLFSDDLTRKEKVDAMQLASSKYRQDHWNRMR